MQIRKTLVNHVDRVCFDIDQIEHRQNARERALKRNLVIFMLSVWSFFARMVASAYVLTVASSIFLYSSIRKVWLIKHCYKQPSDLGSKEKELKYYVYIPNSANGPDRMALAYETWMEKYFNEYSERSRLFYRNRRRK